MKHKKPFKETTRINRPAVERLALLLFNNVIKDENINEMPIVDQANILLKCVPYLLEKKGSETMVSEKDVSNITRMASQAFIASKRIDDKAKQEAKPIAPEKPKDTVSPTPKEEVKEVVKERPAVVDAKRMKELKEKIKLNPNIIA